MDCRYIEANAACYFVIDFGRLVPGLGLPDGTSAIDGETELMRRMNKSGVHIVSQPEPFGDQDSKPYTCTLFTISESNVAR